MYNMFKMYRGRVKRTFILYLSISIMLIMPILFCSHFNYDKFKANPITSVLLQNNILKNQKEFPMPVAVGLVASGAVITGFTLAEVL